QIVFASPDARSQSVFEVVVARHGNASTSGSRHVSFNCLRTGETACVAERTVCAACTRAGQTGTDARETRKTCGRAKCRFTRVARHTPPRRVQHEAFHVADSKKK